MMISPPMLSTVDFTTSMPTPRPEISVASRAVEKPGVMIICRASSSDIWVPGWT